MTEALLFSHTANRFSPKASFRGTVSRILSSCRLRGMERIIYLSSLTRVSVPCGTRSGQLLEPPIWPCTRRGFPCPGDLSPGGGLLHHLFTLTESLLIRRYILCGTFRQHALKRAPHMYSRLPGLRGAVSYGVRTFLFEFPQSDSPSL